MKNIISVAAILCMAFSAYGQRVSVLAKPAGTMRIMSYNIRNCRGMDDRANIKRTADVINRISPDVVALQEVDSLTTRSGKIDLMAELSEKTMMYPVFAAAIDHQGGKYGVGVLSSEKPLSHKSVPLPGREEARVLLIVEFKDYVFCCTHLSLTEQDRLASVAIILDQVKEYSKPVVLAGDLNTGPSTACIRELNKNWEIMSDTTKFTFPANRPEETIDYIMGYQGKNKINVKNTVTFNEPVASDHLPLFIDVIF